jgi:hypothetical protein
MRRPSKKLTIAVAAVGIIAIGGGTALAFWTTTGSGTGTATTGTSTAWAVTSNAPAGGPLSPNGPTETVAVHVTNPGSGTQHLNGVTAAVANSDGTAWTAVTGCSAADYTVSITTISGDVLAAGTASGTATIRMIDTGSNQDLCKGVTVPLYFAAS